MKPLYTLFAALFLINAASAQTPAKSETADATHTVAESRSQRADRRMETPAEMIPLQYAVNPNDGNEILTGLRLMLDPGVKLYLVPNRNVILIQGLPEEVAAARRIVAAIDKPHPLYRLTYTVTESDGGREVGEQHFALEVAVGGRTTVKNGSKVPVVTGQTGASPSESQTQFTYLDVGLNVDASLDEVTGGARLRSKVEQSSVASQSTISGINEPVIRQTVLEGTAFLVAGKPLMLGSLDLTGSTRHLDIAVVMEPVR